MNTLRHNACTKHTVYVPSSISEISNMFWNIISAFFPHPINWANVSGVMYLHSRFSHVLPNHLHEETQRHPEHKPPALRIYSHRKQYLWLVCHYLLAPFLYSHADLWGTQAPPDYLTHKPGIIRQHGKGRGNKPRWAEGWPSLVFSWISEGTAKLATGVNVVHDKGCEPSNDSCVLFSFSVPQVWCKLRFQKKNCFKDMVILEVFGCQFG